MTRRVMCIAVTVAALSLAVLSSACSQEQISEQPALVRSAEQGDAVAQAALGLSYATGDGVPQDDGEAVHWYRLAADQGNARAQANLGVSYANGEGVPQDNGEAVRWLRLAADQGDARAQANLGVSYANGRGVPQDDGEAVRWYRLAADQGDARAQANLGASYATGRGVPEDDGEAVRWYRLAADQGNARAQTALGLMYANGRGVPQDDGEAVHWYRLAADQGDARVQTLLGTMYHTGRGVPQDESEAVRWYRLAADQGNEDARKLRDTLAEAISAGQIAAAQQAERDRRRVPQAALGSTQPAVGTQESTSAADDTDRALREMRDRGQSDDAESVDEVTFHGMARAAVILNVEPNTLGVGGGEFRVKRNPVAPGGAFVYDPRDVFAGVTRNLVWWVPSGDVTALTAYPLNGPSQLVTPGLEFPARAGLLDVPDTADVVSYVFRGEPMETTQTAATDASSGSFTVREYRIYRAVIDTPFSVSEADAMKRVAERNDINADEVSRITTMVLKTLSGNSWLGFPAQEIRRASDWNGESP